MTFEKMDVHSYGQSDLGKKYKKTQSQASQHIDSTEVDRYWQQVEQNGYVIIEDVITPELLQQTKDICYPLLEKTGRNSFEGAKTQRIYSVIAKTMACNHFVDHPLAMALLDRVLSPGYLLSQLQVINILPGEAQQPMHTDDAFYPNPRPRPALGAATIFAIDDFTEANGATAVIPGSHQWGDEMPAIENDTRQIPAVMPAGSMLFFLGTTWHSGGENRSDSARLCVTAQYCEPYLRQQENYSLSIPQHIVAQCTEDIKRMLGYSIYGPFVGMVDGMHPKRLLERYATN